MGAMGALSEGQWGRMERVMWGPVVGFANRFEVTPGVPRQHAGDTRCFPFSGFSWVALFAVNAGRVMDRLGLFRTAPWRILCSDLQTVSK